MCHQHKPHISEKGFAEEREKITSRKKFFIFMVQQCTLSLDGLIGDVLRNDTRFILIKILRMASLVGYGGKKC